MRVRARVRVRVRLGVRVKFRGRGRGRGVGVGVANPNPNQMSSRLVLVSQVAAEGREDIGVDPQHLIERACSRKMASLMGTRVGVASTRVRGRRV